MFFTSSLQKYSFYQCSSCVHSSIRITTSIYLIYRSYFASVPLIPAPISIFSFPISYQRLPSSLFYDTYIFCLSSSCFFSVVCNSVQLSKCWLFFTLMPIFLLFITFLAALNTLLCPEFFVRLLSYTIPTAAANSRTC